MQLGQALGIACSGEQPGAPAPLACAERRISHRHLQGTAAQATEPDPRGAEGGNELHLSSSAGLVYPDPEGFPSQPEHCLPVSWVFQESGVALPQGQSGGRSTPHPHSLCRWAQKESQLAQVRGVRTGSSAGPKAMHPSALSSCQMHRIYSLCHFL